MGVGKKQDVYNPEPAITPEEIEAAIDNSPNISIFTPVDRAKLDSIEGELRGVPVETETELANIDLVNVVNNQHRYVLEEQTDYYFNENANAGDVAPNTQSNSTGFWIRKNSQGMTGAEISVALFAQNDTNNYSDNEKSLLANSLNTANEALTKATDATTIANNANSSALVADAKAVNAFNLAQLAKDDTVILDAKVDSVQTTANTANAAATIANSTANIAKEKAEANELSLQELSSVVTTLQAKTSSLETEVLNLKNKIIYAAIPWVAGNTHKIVSVSDNGLVQFFINVGDNTNVDPKTSDTSQWDLLSAGSKIYWNASYSQYYKGGMTITLYVKDGIDEEYKVKSSATTAQKRIKPDSSQGYLRIN